MAVNRDPGKHVDRGENRAEDEPVEAVAKMEQPTQGRAELAALFERYHRRVFLAAHRITGNAMDAEDAMQTVFTRLAGRTGPDLTGDAGGYLHRAAVNAALDIVRSRRTEPATSLQDVGDALPDPGRATAERGLVDREIRERVRAALADLSRGAAEAFALRYFEGYDNHEIARMTGASRSTVGVMLHRARQHLRHAIRDLGERHHEQE